MDKAIYSEKGKILREWIEKIRHEKKLSLRDLGAMLDIHHSILGKIETGERQINVIELIQICRALNVDPNAIVTQLYKMKP